jgi:DNA-binding NarL/FixJ family response regulator
VIETGTELAINNLREIFLYIMSFSKRLPGSRPFARPTAGLAANSTPALNAGQQELAKERVRVLLAEDHPIVRKGIITFLSQHPKLEVIGEARDGQEAVKKAKELTPDVVLMDVDMPHLNGFAVTEMLRDQLPAAKVILLSAYSGAQYVPRILQSGARGYLSKQASSEEMLTAIELVAAGDTYFGPEISRIALNQLVGKNGDVVDASRLTDREREIIILIAEGLSNKEIAARLDIGTRTVETHRERIMRKLNIHSTAGLTTFAVANGLVPLPGAPLS